ncbi:MAG: hypothetical protein PF570_06125, partial [Candidatus Cloacimonetes bacterium]|nr:hypothetical protein [Candidatus Cloacimonadota bacterium]
MKVHIEKIESYDFDKIYQFIEKLQIDITPLTEEEKARAIEIAKSEPKIKEMIPDLEERKIIVKPLYP